GISREAQDAYVVRSQQRVAAATAAGKFAEEIVPFTTTMRVTDKVTGTSHDAEVTLDRDEGPRPDTTLAGLAALKPVYPGGTTTRRQRLAALRRCGGCGPDGCRSSRTSQTADPRPLPWHAARGGRARGDEHRDRAGDPAPDGASRARDGGRRAVGAARGV